METPEDISAKMSLALNHLNGISDEETRTSVALLTEIVNRLLGTLTAQETTITSITARVDTLERQITEHVSDNHRELVSEVVNG